MQQDVVAVLFEGIYMALVELSQPDSRPRVCRVLLAVGLAGIWLAYALFAAFPNIIFMMLSCVVLGAGVFFFAEWLSLVSSLITAGTAALWQHAALALQRQGPLTSCSSQQPGQLPAHCASLLSVSSCVSCARLLSCRTLTHPGVPSAACGTLVSHAHNIHRGGLHVCADATQGLVYHRRCQRAAVCGGSGGHSRVCLHLPRVLC